MTIFKGTINNEMFFKPDKGRAFKASFNPTAFIFGTLLDCFKRQENLVKVSRSEVNLRVESLRQLPKGATTSKGQPSSFVTEFSESGQLFIFPIVWVLSIFFSVDEELRLYANHNFSGSMPGLLSLFLQSVRTGNLLSTGDFVAKTEISQAYHQWVSQHNLKDTFLDLDYVKANKAFVYNWLRSITSKNYVSSSYFQPVHSTSGNTLTLTACSVDVGQRRIYSHSGASFGEVLPADITILALLTGVKLSNLDTGIDYQFGDSDKSLVFGADTAILPVLLKDLLTERYDDSLPSSETPVSLDSASVVSKPKVNRGIAKPSYSGKTERRSDSRPVKPLKAGVSSTDVDRIQISIPPRLNSAFVKLLEQCFS